MFRILLCLLFISQALNLFSQNYWLPQDGQPPVVSGERRIVPVQYRTLRLNIPQMQSALASAPERFTAAAAEQFAECVLPSPDGGTARFRLFESPVMAPALQAKYPEIRCFTGVGIDQPTLRVKCDWTPWGFHAMVTGDPAGAWFIDPYSHGDAEYYVSYYKKDYQSDEEPFACLTDPAAAETEIKNPAGQADQVSDCRLRTYRLALACTGEYATFHGGTVPLVLAAMNTTMNRVNGVYENELAVTMQLIPNNDLLVYLNAATDPYANSNGSTMLGQNVTTINSVIGLANYDIGHVFSTGGGGIAGLGVVCANGKARGVTGGGSPVGDPFDIDYVAHEMGHQFGANHTQNNNCNRVATASMEPGSASTIMGYAGICSPNVQNNSDDYFHAISLQEMGAFITNGSGNTCPVKTTTGNNQPEVSAGADYVIPKSTPFALTAVGTDADGDSLSFCWEQMDPQFATMPPVASNAGGPLFRSFKATPSPTRYFPRLPDLVNNVNSAWEELPGVARTMNFRVTIRDNRPDAGCTDEDNMLVTVAAAAGPFVVTEPNTNIVWTAGELQAVTWDVAGTNAAPVQCSYVRILLSTDGGFSYPIVLADSVPNTGSADVFAPLLASNTCRVLVAGLGNIFFDISNQNFRIELPPYPTFLLTTSLSSAAVCAGDTLRFSINTNSILGFSDTITCSLDGVPPGATVEISPAEFAPDETAQVVISGLTSDMAGNYALSLVAVADTLVRAVPIALSVLPGAPTAAVIPVSPLDSTLGVSGQAVLNWNPVQYAAQYAVQLASSPSFESGALLLNQLVTDTFIATPPLAFAQVYYWRVRPLNNCGDGLDSEVFAFQIGDADCDIVFNSADVPVAINTANTSVVYSKITVSDLSQIADIAVNVAIAHTYVGDLSARLLGPAGFKVQLFDRPGVPASQFGCEGDNISATFRDDAPQSAAAFEAACGGGLPAISGQYRPVNNLSVFKGLPAQGEWLLEVRDDYDGDGGALTAWSLDFCYTVATPPTALLLNEPMDAPRAGTRALSADYLSGLLTGAAVQGKFTLLSVPAHGMLMRQGVALGVGGVFTQDDINSGAVVYAHNGDDLPTDHFRFDFQDENNGAWLHNSVFLLNIRENTLSGGADILSPVACADDANGQIAVTVSGGYPPFEYSLNGAASQSDSQFDQLAAGIYTVVVTDALGFTLEMSSVTLDNPAPLTLSAQVTGYTVEATATGGTGDLTYSLDGQNFQSESVFNDVPEAFYTLLVRDANGCTAGVQIVVSVDLLLASAEATSQALCNGGAEGALVVAPVGGVPPYTFSLDGLTFQSENTFTGLIAGTYTPIVQDNLGSSTTAGPVVITEPVAISLDAQVNLNVITVNAFGGTGSLSYSLDGQNFGSGNVFSDLFNGEYNVIVRDANGCTAGVTVVVDVPPLNILALDASALLCAGDQSVLTAIVTGGIPPYQFSLDNGAFQAENVFENVEAGSHTVVVRDAAGTEIATTLLLESPAALGLDVSVVGNDVTGVTPSGGVPPYELAFDSAIPSDLMNIPSGDYFITLTDANGCSILYALVINYTVVSADFVSSNPLCSGDANGSVEILAQNGTPPYEYAINGSAFQSAGTFENLASGQYDITVRDALGDLVSLQVVLSDPAPLSAIATVTSDTIIVTAFGGTGLLQYSLDGQTYQTSNLFPDLANGAYDVRVRDANGCLYTVDKVVVNYVSTVDPVSVWGLRVAPNPGSGLFRLRMDRAPAQAMQAVVLDGAGRLLRSLVWRPSGAIFETDLDLRDLPQGAYILQLRMEGLRVAAIRLQVAR